MPYRIALGMAAPTRILGKPSGAGTVSNGPTGGEGVPESIAGYSVLRCIGAGGMGSVYEVRHNVLDKLFAMKLLSDSLRGNSEAIERFRSETSALGKLQHPNIVVASDAGVWQGRPYLVTELLQGQDLAHRIAETGKLDSDLAISIAAQLADGLYSAHTLGYFHRDIKPSNIFLLPDGKAKLLDFGLVRSESNHSLTRTNCFMGTVDFVAPEQAGNASQAGAASDIYSLGCTLIYLLSGNVPFPDDHYPSMTSKLQAHLQDTPKWLDHAANEQPDWLVRLIRAMIAKNPMDRPACCQSIKKALESRCYPGTPVAHATFPKILQPSSTSTYWIIGFASMVALCVGGWSLSSNQPSAKDEERISTTSSTPSVDMPRESSNPDTPIPNHPLSSEQEPVEVPAKSARSARSPKEKTLPVGHTQNANGISFQGLQFGQSTTARPTSTPPSVLPRE